MGSEVLGFEAGEVMAGGKEVVDEMSGVVLEKEVEVVEGDGEVSKMYTSPYTTLGGAVTRKLLMTVNAPTLVAIGVGKRVMNEVGVKSASERNVCEVVTMIARSARRVVIDVRKRT